MNPGRFPAGANGSFEPVIDQDQQHEVSQSDQGRQDFHSVSPFSKVGGHRPERHMQERYGGAHRCGDT